VPVRTAPYSWQNTNTTTQIGRRLYIPIKALRHCPHSIQEHTVIACWLEHHLHILNSYVISLTSLDISPRKVTTGGQTSDKPN